MLTYIFRTNKNCQENAIHQRRPSAYLHQTEINNTISMIILLTIIKLHDHYAKQSVVVSRLSVETI